MHVFGFVESWGEWWELEVVGVQFGHYHCSLRARPACALLRLTQPQPVHHCWCLPLFLSAHRPPPTPHLISAEET